ncbi:solute carrier family 16 member 6b isoform X2 [Oryzias melastigma]|uniref:solute carrier family 16 member 6b isoform X2 n=1 Tax=Oryzias melastigma TaxID=30732 RepID=UPI000CF7C2BB|nr:solute carrier family 16 member 6b isoform X2 [Oryzias melastigma]XP_024147074.1 solute carrier family 16 member 6b isoform X2 [Oryzias melastigma]
MQCSYHAGQWLSCPPLFLSFSGFGYCLSFLPTVTILAQYFCRRRSLVTSVASSGESFAVFAFAPVFSRLKEDIGWRYCLIIMGVIQASIISCGLLLRPIVIEPETVQGAESKTDSASQSDYELENEKTCTSVDSALSRGSEDSGVPLSEEDMGLEEEKAKEELERPLPPPPSPTSGKDGSFLPDSEAGPLKPRSPKLLDFSVLRDGAFIWYSLFGLFATLGFFAPQLYVTELSKSRGVPLTASSCMLSVMAVAEIFGRLSIGVVLNRVRCRKTVVLLGCVVLLCLVLVAFTVVWEFWGLVVCCALYGFFLGTVASTHIPMLAEEDVVGIQKMSSCVGVYVFIQSFAGLAGPPLGGVLVDVTENYGAAFYSCAAGMGLSAVCLALVGVAKSGMWQRRSRQEQTDVEQEEKLSGCSDDSDFLELDFGPQNGPVPAGKDLQESSVI